MAKEKKRENRIKERERKEEERGGRNDQKMSRITVRIVFCAPLQLVQMTSTKLLIAFLPLFPCFRPVFFYPKCLTHRNNKHISIVAANLYYPNSRIQQGINEQAEAICSCSFFVLLWLTKHMTKAKLVVACALRLYLSFLRLSPVIKLSFMRFFPTHLCPLQRYPPTSILSVVLSSICYTKFILVNPFSVVEATPRSSHSIISLSNISFAITKSNTEAVRSKILLY